MKATAHIANRKERSAGSGLNLPLVMAVALIVAGLSIVLNSLLGMGRASEPVDAPVVQSATDILTAGTGSRTGYADRIIASSRQKLEQNPQDYRALAELGLALQQKARESNDPAHYAQAEDALRKALVIQPGYYDALAGMGALSLSLHDFKGALEWGVKARAASPDRAYSYGVIGDAQVELGDDEAAVHSFQTMVDLRPDLSSYSRVSYARELHGDVPGAIEAMKMAVSAGSPAAENTAWCRVQLGNLYFGSGRLAEAEKEYTEALAGYPGYLHAYAGLAQVRWAQGQTKEAIDLYTRSVESVPLPQYLAALGDLYSASGDKRAAQEQYDTVLYIFKVFETGGVNVDIEKAAFLAERGLDAAQAVQLAERAAKERRDVNTLDTLAWSYYRAGRYEEAKQAMEGALRLGTRSALFNYHLGMIEQATGNSDEAKEGIERALEINPHFSILHSEDAARMVRK